MPKTQAASPQLAHNNLDRLMTSDRQLGFLPALLTLAAASLPSVKMISLFGSRAQGDQTRRSDVDLLFEFTSAPGPEWITFCQSAEDQARTLLDLDMVRADNAEPTLLASAKSEGIIIY